MVGEVFAGLTAFKTMIDLVRGLKDASDAATRNAVAIDLQQRILDAQSAQSELAERNRELEREVAHLREWGAEKAEYEFSEVSRGIYAYTPKPETERAKVFHMLCANCYDRNEKSVLQSTQELRMRRRVYFCPNCRSEYTMEGIDRPEPRVDPGPAGGGSWAGSRRG